MDLRRPGAMSTLPWRESACLAHRAEQLWEVPATLSLIQVHPPGRRSESQGRRARGPQGHDTWHAAPRVWKRLPLTPAEALAGLLGFRGGSTAGADHSQTHREPGPRATAAARTRPRCRVPATLERCRSTEEDAGSEWTRSEPIRAAPLPRFGRKSPSACRNAQVDTGSTGSERMTHPPGHATEMPVENLHKTEPSGLRHRRARSSFRRLAGFGYS
jgi:hypothetical protein